MEKARMETPLYKHHCKACIYLGSFVQEQGIYHELYFCPARNRVAGQVVSCWGNDPWTPIGFDLSPLRSERGPKLLDGWTPIREAFRRAEAVGLARQ